MYRGNEQRMELLMNIQHQMYYTILDMLNTNVLQRLIQKCVTNGVLGVF
jgi:hypothetical protein